MWMLIPMTNLKTTHTNRFNRGGFRVRNLATKIKDLWRLTKQQGNKHTAFVWVAFIWCPFGYQQQKSWLKMMYLNTFLIIGQASTKLKPLTSSTKPRLSSLHVPHIQMLLRRYKLQISWHYGLLKWCFAKRFLSNMRTVHNFKHNIPEYKP